MWHNAAPKLPARGLSWLSLWQPEVAQCCAQAPSSKLAWLCMNVSVCVCVCACVCVCVRVRVCVPVCVCSFVMLRRVTMRSCVMACCALRRFAVLGHAKNASFFSRVDSGVGPWNPIFWARDNSGVDPGIVSFCDTYRTKSPRQFLGLPQN